MAHLTFKTATFKIDSSTGVLTDITGDVNSASLAAALNLLEDSSAGDDDRTYVPGLHGKTISFNGWLNTTTEGIFGPLLADRTSITKTVQYHNGIKYYNGEVWPGNVQISGSPDTIQTWSADLTFEGGANRTSVAL